MSRCELLAASALIATALAVGAPARAATTFTGNGSSSIMGGTGAFYDSGIPAGTFTDTIQFTVPTAGSSNVGVLYFKFANGISNLAASFNGDPITFSPVGTFAFSGEINKLVSSGLQTITITGNSGGLGSYSGNVTFTSAVPELATWLMMITGIGFTGVAMRRRKSAYKVNYAF
jgi:hypothetical protein